MVELGQSPVPLDRDVVRRDPENFKPTFMEWASDKFEQRIEQAERLNTVGTTTVFTVPEGFTMFLTNASCSVSCNGLGTSGFGGAGNLIIANEVCLKAATDDGNASQSQFTWNFMMPFKLNSGETVRLFNNSIRNQTLASIVGFLVPNKISISQLF